MRLFRLLYITSTSYYDWLFTDSPIITALAITSTMGITPAITITTMTICRRPLLRLLLVRHHFSKDRGRFLGLLVGPWGQFLGPRPLLAACSRGMSNLGERNRCNRNASPFGRCVLPPGRRALSDIHGQRCWCRSHPTRQETLLSGRMASRSDKRRGERA